ncbi:MAG: glycosyltransferase, partial [Aeromicrobium sp.]
MPLFRKHHPDPGLPQGRQFALTWNIPENFGGLTKAMLQRSGAFATTAGTPVSILTFSLQSNIDKVRTDLLARGLLGDGVTLHNLWEDVRELPDEALREAKYDLDLTVPGTIGPNTLKILRGDGTLLATQEWARVGTGKPMCEFGDYVLQTALWGHDGSFVGGWHGSWGLWKFWLDRQMSEPDSYAIVDSSVIADFMAHRGPDSATTVYLFHNSHLLRRREPPYAPLDRWRRYVSAHHADFDALVFLTEAQRIDFGRLLGGVDNSHTILNIVPRTEVPARIKRSRNRAVVLARFAPQKRLDHALRAVTAAGASHPDLHLDLYGTGPREDDLRALAKELDAPVTFHGYTQSPASEFAGSSFSLLTSTHEGLGLSIIESMATGCVPLAYDVPYGPSDIITHGVDGFLVPAGDHKAMARQISEFLALDDRAVERLRKAGRKRAEFFTESSIIEQWGNTLRAARVRQASTAVAAPTMSTLRAEEAKAAVARFVDIATHAELIEASWRDNSHLTMTVRVSPSAHYGSKKPVVAAKLIHHPTGEAVAIPVSVPAGVDTARESEDTALVQLDVDVSEISGTLDHTILLGLTSEDDPAWDVIRTQCVTRPWLAFPEASEYRPVLIFDRKRGIHLATATPKIAARATTNGREVSLSMLSFASGKIESVQ